MLKPWLQQTNWCLTTCGTLKFNLRAIYIVQYYVPNLGDKDWTPQLIGESYGIYILQWILLHPLILFSTLPIGSKFKLSIARSHPHVRTPLLRNLVG